LSPVATEPPRLKADCVLVAGAVVEVVPGTGALNKLPPGRVLVGAGDDVEISLGLGAREGNKGCPESVSVRLSDQICTRTAHFTCCGRGSG
jgi:hypothetical protein